MIESIHRRRFLGAARPGPNGTIVIGVLGMGGRGTSHATEFAALPGVEVASVCDVDARRAAEAAAAVPRVPGRTTKAVGNFRRILDDPEAMTFWSREYALGWEPKG